MDEIILHHYPPSPVSEKVRVALGIKGLSWRSVEIPRLPPKPDVMPLTGGYRRTPIMQVGADIYCDSQCILRELQRRHPEPSFYPGGAAGLPWGISRWTDALFDTAVRLSMGANADKLPEGGVLVVGASASGAQLAREIRLSGRPVTIAVGCHFRLPRVYRGRDIMWWLDRTGAFDRPTNATTNPAEPSMQLMGHPERLDIDVGVLRDMGVRIAGRVAGIADGAREAGLTL